MTEVQWFYAIYGCATLILLGLLRLWLAARNLSVTVVNLFVASLLMFFLIPAAVPDTSAVAPAWAIALFEWALGRPEAVAVAMRPVAYALLLLYSAVFIGKLALRRRHHE